ncbi:hypothetical protein AGOR_G00166980 [Albula goreensis]|uniref:Tripartite motif-containing protein 66 n=1 Tax=Albula goreensis TaxID=1534307 RepID=A0A8T3D041_9TELE|nr:hypothetical protein AGOR_G00166980 [Albula goreensis]
MEKLCSHCREPRDAQSLCTFCNKWLCYQCTDMHQDHRTTGSLLLLDPAKRPTQMGSGCWSSGIPLCHFHKQEPLDLFCESCDLLSCSSCHLTTHRDHRVVHVGKALQNQIWLLENLMVQVEDKKSAVENTAKQIEDRLHGVKIMQRKAENQIKMAKMIMINELNKRANLLIEELERVSNEFKLRLEDQLQGMIELCSQLGHVQNFISWATAHHQRNPLLFSKELVGQITFQMQRLLESQLRSDLDPPVKIKFNWDASFWTKQISTLGHLTAEGGSHTRSVGMSCSSILKPRPIPCSALPTSLCHGLDQGCSFQTHFQPQMCCPHCVNVPAAPAPHPDLLVGRSRGSPGEHQGVGCHSIVGPHLERPEVRPAVEMNKRQMESSVCPAAGVQPSQGLPPLYRAPPQGQCEPQSPSTQVTHTHQHLQQQGSMQVPPGGLVNTPLHSSSSSPPKELQAAQSSLQLLLQSPHQLQTERLPGRQVQLAADRILTEQGQQALGQANTVTDQSDADATLEQSRAGPAGALGRHSPSQQPGEQTHAETQTQTPPVPERRSNQSAERHSVVPVRPLQSSSDCRGPASLEMLALAHDLPSNAPRGPSSLQGRRPVSQSSSEEPAAAAAPSPTEACPMGVTNSLATAAEDQHPLAGQDDDSLPSEGAEGAGPGGTGQGVSQGVTSTPDPIITSPDQRSSCKTEPGKIYACEDTGVEGRARLRISRKLRQDFRSGKETTKGSRAPRGSRLPLVRLERLRFRLTTGQLGASRVPPRGQRNGRHGLETPTEGTLAQEPRRIPTPEELQKKGRLDEKADLCIKVSQLSSQTDQPKECQASRPTISSAGTKLGPEQEIPEKEYPRRPKPKTGLGPESDSEPQSEFEPNLESEPDLESDPESGSEQQPESVPGVETEPPPESDSVMEPHPDPEPYLDPVANALSGGSPESSPVPGPSSEHMQEQVNDSDGQVLSAESEAPEGVGQMENEDFCAVCRNGGDLLCCDYCPKVFHLSCHVPPLLSFPTGDWVCSLCRDVLKPEVEYDCENTRLSRDPMGKGGPHGLGDCDQRRCEKLTLFISCNILSAPFHEPVSPLARHYYQIIKKPMDLSVIRSKLNRRSHSHYYTPKEFVDDVFLMFRNCAKFNYPDSEVAQAGRSLETFFSTKLREVFSDRTFMVPDDDSDSEEYEEFYTACAAGFPWPGRKEHCHRKRKRRHSVTSRRHHL